MRSFVSIFRARPVCLDSPEALDSQEALVNLEQSAKTRPIARARPELRPRSAPKRIAENGERFSVSRSLGPDSNSKAVSYSYDDANKTILLLKIETLIVAFVWAIFYYESQLIEKMRIKET